jgi:hypothetical protein
MFVGLHKTMRKKKQERRKNKSAQGMINYDVLKQMHFIVNDGNSATLECFNLRTNAV